MECRTAQRLLEAYLDNEVDRADARELEAHADGCAECRAALTRLDDLRRALRDEALRHRAPDELRARIAAAHAAAGGIAPPSEGAAPRRAAAAKPWWGIAAACVLAFASGGIVVDLWNPARPGAADERALVAHDLFASHWRALAAATPVDVVSSDRHTVKPWFAGKVAQSPLVIDFADAGFPLVGGRVDYVGGARVPVLVYRHGQHLLDVFILPPAAAASVGSSVQQQGYRIESVMLGGQPAAIVSDTDPQELARFAGLLAAAH